MWTSDVVVMIGVMAAGWAGKIWEFGGYDALPRLKRRLLVVSARLLASRTWIT